jgi:hypothetical protein
LKRTAASAALEMGASLGHWESRLALTRRAPWRASTRPEVLPAACAAAGLCDRITWYLYRLAAAAELAPGPFDLIVLHQVCHTLTSRASHLPGSRLGGWHQTDYCCSTMPLAGLAPPRRHLLQVSPLATGGGRVLTLPARPTSAGSAYNTAAAIDCRPLT